VGAVLSNLLRNQYEAMGLEIGASNLKLVELGGRGPQLRSFAHRPTPPGLFHDGLIAEPAALAEEIRELVKEARTKKRHVVTALANQVAYTRIIKVPRMERKELEEAIRWEAERYIPFPIDEVVLDFDLLDDPEELEEGAEMEVVIAAAKEETVVQLAETLFAAGLEPLVVDLKPFAGIRPLAARLGTRENGEGLLTLYLEVGGESSSLVFLKGDRPLLVRTLAVAGRDFTQAIARAFGMEPEQAEETKKEYALATLSTEDEEALLELDAPKDRPSPAEIYDAIRGILIDFTTEVRRSLEFFKSEFGEESLDQAFVAGGGSKLKGLKGLLSDALGITFSEIDPWEPIKIDTGRFDAGLLQELGPEFVVPVGLALRGVSKLG